MGAGVKYAAAGLCGEVGVKEMQRGNRVSPGFIGWLAVIGSLAFVLLMFYVLVFVGSERNDAESQMFVVKLILLGSSICTVFSAFSVWNTLRLDLRWNEQGIEFNSRNGQRVSKKYEDVTSAEDSIFRKSSVYFRDGSTLHFSSDAAGAISFFEYLNDRTGVFNKVDDDNTNM
jgi:hypothetical protein